MASPRSARKSTNPDHVSGKSITIEHNSPEAVAAACRDADIWDDAQVAAIQARAATAPSGAHLTINVNTYLKGESKASIKTPYALLIVPNFRKLAELGLTTASWRVLAYALEAMNFGNSLHFADDDGEEVPAGLLNFSQKACCEELSLSSSTVSRSFSEMENKRVFVRVRGHLYINSAYFIKGLPHRLNDRRRDDLRTAQDDAGGTLTRSI